MIGKIEPKDIGDSYLTNPKIKILDVRQPEEFQEIRAKDAKLLPLGEVNRAAVEELLELKDGDEVYVICRSGKRSMTACQILENEGMTNSLFNIEGGTISWAEGGFSVEKN